MPTPYHAEDFTESERARLEPYVSNMNRPVFVLVGLSQATAAAVFARYSRSAKSLRRLLLDEFLDEPPTAPTIAAGRGRAQSLLGRVLAEYGDDSVAQLAGVHVACEQVSQPLAKAIEWGRLASYLEQSTRYIPYTDQRDGCYRYHRDPELLASDLGSTYIAAMDGLFATYCGLVEPLHAHLDAVLPSQPDTRARTRAIRALGLDLMRALLPAGTVSNVGVFASPQSLEQMVMRLRAHPLPEARSYADLIAAELQATIPDFVSRLDRPDRGGAWTEYLADLHTALAAASAQLAAPDTMPAGDEVRLQSWDRDGEIRIMAAALFPHADHTSEELLRHVAALPADAQDRVFAAAVGPRRNRRHRPGRSFEHTDYTFDVVADYGAFRDLQRHRLLTVQWQPLTPTLGYAIPAEVIDAGLADRWRSAVDRAEEAYARVVQRFPQQAAYLVTLGHRLRYQMKLNAREALHVIELRTSPQGHPSYRRIAREMHRLIGEVAGHRRVAQAAMFVGREDVHLPRYEAEAAVVGRLHAHLHSREPT